MSDKKIAKIIPSKNTNLGELSYEIPKEMNVQVGNIVKIPFKKSEICGLVIGITSELPKFKLKEIIEVKEIKLSMDKVDLIKWISNFFYCNLYAATKLFLPEKIWNDDIGALKKKREKKGVHINNEKINLSNIKDLTTDQKKVYEDIKNSDKLLHLIHGVTGSGKTEIYLHLIKDCLESKSQALLLLPEIALTPQTEQYFKKVFGEKVITWHSEQTPAQKLSNWMKIHHQEVDIVVGARSALFAPFKNLGLIVVDECHDGSFKQTTMPRYSTLISSVKYGDIRKIKTVFGSATPPVEIYYATTQNKIELHLLKNKIHNNSNKVVSIVDMKNERRAKNFSTLSNLLVRKIEEKLNKKEQIILFVNRRGMASSMICSDCGYKAFCEKCAIALTYHKSFKEEYLMCHHCSKQTKVLANCPQCDGYEFKLQGIGTEKIEDEIQKTFPQARLLRADKDSTLKKGAIEKIFNSFKGGEADILIGTQMITKGWDIPNVTLVGILLADIGLSIPDYKSGERVFQLLTQVSGRTARGEKHGEVIVQTYSPENKVINLASQENFNEFYNYELEARKKHYYPPFCKIISLSYSDKNQNQCKRNMENVFKTLQKFQRENDEIYLTPHFIPYSNNEYHYSIFIHSNSPEELVSKIDENIIKTLKIDRN